MRKGKKIWNRLLSLVLCLVMVTGVFAGMGMKAKAASKDYTFQFFCQECFNNTGNGAVRGTAKIDGVLYETGKVVNLDTSYHSVEMISVEGEHALTKSNGKNVPVNTNDHLFSWNIYHKSKITVLVINQNGTSLSGKTVYENYNNNSGTTNAEGKYEFYARKSKSIDITVRDDYGDISQNIYATNDSHTVTITIPERRNVTVSLKSEGNQLLTGYGYVYACEESKPNDRIFFDDDENGVYTKILYAGQLYTLNIGDVAGYKSKESTLDGNATSLDVQLELEEPEVNQYFDTPINAIELSVGDSISGLNISNNVKGVWNLKGPGGTYTWASDNLSVFTVTGEDSKTVTGVSAGTANLKVTVNSCGASKTTTIPVTVSKGQTEYPTPTEFKTENVNDIKAETFKLPSNLKGADKVVVTAKNANEEVIKEQTFTDLSNGEIALDFGDNALIGPITYTFNYSSEKYYDYINTPQTLSRTYYVTKPFAVTLVTEGENVDENPLVYGDNRKISLNLDASEGGYLKDSKFKFDVSDTNETIDMIPEYTVTDVSNSTIASDVKILAASLDESEKIIVIRERDDINYWAEESIEVPIKVNKKVIDPLKATYSQASDEAAIYDGKKDYKAIGALDLSELVPGDTLKAQLSTTLVLPSADADTYNADTDEIQIGNVSLKATIRGNQAELDRNYELKVTAPTTAIEKSGDLEINKKEINPLLPNYQKADSEIGIYDGETSYEVVGTVEAADGDENGLLIAEDTGKALITASLELPSDDVDTYKAPDNAIAIGNKDNIILQAVKAEDAEHIAKNYILKFVDSTEKIEKSKDLVVTPKEIKPLVAVTYASERVYDGINEIEAVGTVGTYSDGGKAKDMDDVSVNATLSIIGKDVGTYTPSNEVITIKEYALSGADAKNYKLPETIPTGKIETSGTSLIIKERPVTVSGFTADDKDYDQSTVATLSSNNVVVANIVNGEDLNVTAKGTFTDKNVERDGSGEAINKTVNISDIALSDGTNGKASNYVLTASGNQESTTATIRPIEAKVLVTVNDKQYDGLNTATIKDAGLDGIINGDIVTLNRGTPKFNGVGEADNEQTIGISFTDFSIEGADAVNYDLTQPTGVTAKIYNDYDAKKDVDYIVNSNDWINEDFVVTAAEGHVISEADDYDGANTWNERLSRSEDITDGELKFYVRDNESGAISKSVIETYNIDTILPTGSVKIAENKWMEFWNNITFEKFFNKTQTVIITADDERSGVAKVEYYESDKELTLDEIKALRDDDWTKGEKVRVTLEDTKKFVYYARITDKAGNVNYLNTDGSVYDTTLPTLKGAKEAEVYYTTQTITVKDTNLATITLDGETVTSTVTLPGNVDKVYKLVAIDKAGNKAALSISMKPLSDLSGDITDSNVTLADEKELEKSEELLKNELEKGNLSDEEKKDVKDRLTEIQNLLQDIDEVKDVIKMLDNLPDAYLEDGETVNPYVSDRMDDEEQKLYSAVKAAYKAYNKLSAHQQSLISTGLKHNLSNLRKVLTDYRITDGDGKVWVYDTNGTITFTANGPVCRFENALVDGKKVPAEEMKVTKGSTVVELDAGYLYRLGLGDHTFQMEYTDGETDVVEFSIVTMEVWNTMMKQSGTNQTGTGAATGDSANILLWGAALAVGTAGMVVAKKRRKDEEA